MWAWQRAARPGKVPGSCFPGGSVVPTRALLRVRMEGRGDAGAGRLAGSTVGCPVLTARLQLVDMWRAAAGSLPALPAATLYSQALVKIVDGSFMMVSHKGEAGGRRDA